MPDALTPSGVTINVPPTQIITPDKVLELIEAGSLYPLNCCISDAAGLNSGIVISPDALDLIRNMRQQALREIEALNPRVKLLNRQVGRRALLGFAGGTAIGGLLAESVNHASEISMPQNASTTINKGLNIVTAGFAGIAAAALRPGMKRTDSAFRLSDLKQFVKLAEALDPSEGRSR